MNKIFALAVCVLLVFSAQVPVNTAALAGDTQAAVAITQEDHVHPETPLGARLVVEGPTEAVVGQLVVISVEKSTASSFKWIVLPSTDDYLVIDEGRRICFSSRAGGVFQFFIACSLGDTVDSTVHTVTVSGPDSPQVDSLASRIATWCDSVESDTKRDECLALAQSFSSVALVMEGGTLTTPKEIVEATMKSNRDALGDKLDAWMPFREGLQAQLTQMARGGELETTEDHIRVWKAVAVGLRKYADKL